MRTFTTLRGLLAAAALIALMTVSLAAFAACGDDDDGGNGITGGLSDGGDNGDGEATADIPPPATFPPTTPGPDTPPDVPGEPTITDSGLGIIEIAVGEGALAGEGSFIAVHYTGWLEDGTKFDSSLDRGQPIELTLGAGQVIPGWEEGLAGMQVGGMRRLIIPPGLAYGDEGFGSVIPPGATLTFDVELMAVDALGG